MRRFSLLTVAAAATGLGIGMLTGCGGGSGSVVLPPASGSATGSASATRAASINAVQGVRRLFQLVSSGFDVPTRRAALPSGPSAAWGRRVLDAIRQRTQAGQSRQTDESPAFDASFGLYVATEESDAETRLNFFTDPLGQNSAGFYSLAVQGDPEQLPATLVITYEITAGLRTGRGTVTFTVSDDQGQNGRISGRDTNSETGLSTQFDLAFTTGGAATTGSATVTDADGTVDVRSISQDENGLTADLASGGAAGTITENAGNGGTLRFNSPAGTVAASWDVDGAGAITQADGRVENIADFDTEP